MLEFSRFKILLILLICLIASWLALPNIVKNNWLFNQTINLGLDLQGGSHLLLDVNMESYLKEQQDMLVDSFRKELREAKIGYTALHANDQGISLNIRQTEDRQKAHKILTKINPDLNTELNDQTINVTFKEKYLEKLENNLIEQSIEIIRRRVDETGTKEPTIQKQGKTNILLQVPGLDNPEYLKQMLGKTAKLSLHLVETEVSSLSRDIEILPVEQDGYVDGTLAVQRKAILTGDMLVDAKTIITDQNKAAVSFSLNSIGAKRFAEVTKGNPGKILAIVLDNKIISAPRINEPILAGQGIISGNFTVASANDLALLLRAGALPAELKIVEERTVGPSLGQDSIESGKKAALLSAIMILIFMIWTYGILGLFANIALLMNLVFITAALSLFQATLTLPGIAGIILTMGMAVDANVLIFERIREDLKSGISPFNAINNGFKKAFTTILDSNLTTVLVAIFLYSFGAGTIKAFAVTLMIGIVSSMFTAITLTRLMVASWFKKFQPARINI